METHGAEPRLGKDARATMLALQWKAAAKQFPGFLSVVFGPILS
jgi:hypothetical protein